MLANRLHDIAVVFFVVGQEGVDEVDFDELLADCDSVLGNKFGRVLMIVVFYHFNCRLAKILYKFVNLERTLNLFQEGKLILLLHCYHDLTLHLFEGKSAQ